MPIPQQNAPEALAESNKALRFALEALYALRGQLAKPREDPAVKHALNLAENALRKSR